MNEGATAVATTPIPQTEAPLPRAKIWTPKWDGVIEGMTVNLINKNMWRFAPLFDFDDIFQTCYMFFLTCCEKYPQVVEEPHFIALYGTCIRNEFHSLARQRSFLVTNVGAPTTDGTEPLDTLSQIPAKPLNRESEFEGIVKDAPDAIHALVEGLARKGRPHKHRKSSSGRRECTNVFLCRIAQLDPARTNLQGMLNDLVSPA